MERGIKHRRSIRIPRIKKLYVSSLKFQEKKRGEKMNIIILGMQGAGKGTQAELIKEHYHIAHVCTGDIFREAYKKKTKLGVKAHDEYWGKGNLVPDDVTNKLLQERLQEKDCKKGFILDGYPRTIAQARFLDNITSIDFVIDLEINQTLAIKRLSKREQCTQCGTIHGIGMLPKQKGTCNNCGGELYKRADDTPEKIKVRIQEYHEKTKPLIEYYKQQGKLYTINAGGKIREVYKEIREMIQQHM